ncbi:UNVERIFIED_ORG: hypothetical protein ABIB19_001289 [Arthrobacter sp. UYEF10]
MSFQLNPGAHTHGRDPQEGSTPVHGILHGIAVPWVTPARC